MDKKAILHQKPSVKYLYEKKVIHAYLFHVYA